MADKKKAEKPTRLNAEGWAAAKKRSEHRKQNNKAANDRQYLRNLGEVDRLQLTPLLKERTVTVWRKKKGKLVEQTTTRSYREKPSKTLRRHKRKGLLPNQGKNGAKLRAEAEQAQQGELKKRAQAERKQRNLAASMNRHPAGKAKTNA